MAVGEQNTRITKQFDSKQLEKLASESDPGSTDSDPRPTCKIHKDELLGLLDMSLGVAPPALPDPTPAGSGTAHARLVPADSTSDGLVTPCEDQETQRMQATHLQSLAEGGLPLTPALLESVDWYRDADAAAAEARMAPRSPEALLDELGGRRLAAVEMSPIPMAGNPGHDDAKHALRPATGPLRPPGRSHAGLRIFISLIVLAMVGFAGFLGFELAT